MPYHEAGESNHLEHWLLVYAQRHDGVANPGDSAIGYGSLEARLRRARRCLGLLSTAWPAAVSYQEGFGAVRRSLGQGSHGEAGKLRFGRFSILGLRGSGGHAMVYQAYDPVLDRDVALKIPHPQWLDTPEFRQRFVQECQLVAQLSHPQLTKVFEAATNGVVCWLVSEYCPGPSLAAWLKERPGRQSPIVAARLIKQLAETVDYIHRRDILHRDIKPGNILLHPLHDSPSEPAGSGELSSFTFKLTDFGLARLTPSDGVHTKTGAVLGTPAYMSPEQAEGRRADVGVATDVYAIGAVLYELLTGRAPVGGRTEWEVLREVAEGRILAPRRIVPNVPVELESICLKCLEHLPRRRYESASALARDLGRFLACEPVAARPPKQLARLGKWSRRNPIVATLCAVITIGLSTGMVVFARQSHQVQRQFERAEQNFRQVLQAVTTFHDLPFQGSDFDTPQLRQLRMSMMETALRHYELLLAERPRDRMLLRAAADACQHTAFVHLASDRYEVAIEQYEKALSFWRRLSEMGVEDDEARYFVAQTHGRLGDLLRRQGRLEKALAHIRLSLNLRQQLVRSDPTAVEPARELAECRALLANAFVALGRLDDALIASREGLILRQDIAGRQPSIPQDRRLLAKAYLNVAGVLLARGELGEATEACLQARQIQAELVEHDEAAPWSVADLSQSLRLLGHLKVLSSEPIESLGHYRDACGHLEHLCRDPLGLDAFGRKLADCLTELAGQESACGQLDAAIEHHQCARDIYRTLREYDQRTLHLMKADFYLGQLYLHKKQIRDAVEYFELAIHRYTDDDSPSPAVADEAEYYKNAAREWLAAAQINSPGK